ncbi:MAG: leucyl aminopeptidase [Patescibacteria group bacterium]
MRYIFSKAIEDLPKEVVFVQFSKEKETYVVQLEGGRKALSLGVEEPEKLTRRKLVLLARQVVAVAKAHRFSRLAFSLQDFRFSLKLSDKDLAELLAVNFGMANYEFVEYKTPPKEGWSFMEEIAVLGKVCSEAKKGLERGNLIAGEVNACRDLVNTPGIDMPPRVLAECAQKAAQGTKVKVKALGKQEIEKLGMGGVLGVSRGSAEEPRFIIMEYQGGKKGEKPVVLVGKGVTFDTGGLNVKPGDAMTDMHMDMAGGAAVLHSVVLAAKLGIKKNVVGLVPAVENMPSGTGLHPGDVLRTISGKTIEVLNTDAEGRIILADALGYAKRYNPKLVVDVATLVGAALVALGQRASALFATDERTSQKIQELGEESGDYVWPMPLWDEYAEDVKGTTGDWLNTSKSRYGGVITAALFLKQFAEGYPWVHLDICPRMIALEGEYLAKGAAGAPVRLLAKMLERL